MDHEIVKKMETTKIEDEKGKKAESVSEVINAQRFCAVCVRVCVCVLRIPCRLWCCNFCACVCFGPRLRANLQS